MNRDEEAAREQLAIAADVGRGLAMTAPAALSALTHAVLALTDRIAPMPAAAPEPASRAPSEPGVRLTVFWPAYADEELFRLDEDPVPLAQLLSELAASMARHDGQGGRLGPLTWRVEDVQ